jgi:hypothetical protein
MNSAAAAAAASFVDTKDERKLCARQRLFN